jgi:hypothetical protein
VPIDRQIVSQTADHVKNPFRAELQKRNLQGWKPIENAVADKGDKSQLRRQAHTDTVGFKKVLTDLLKGRVAHAHMDAERQASRSEFFPDRQKTRMGQQAITHRPKYNRRAGTELLHLIDRFARLMGIAHR